jgi:hypothetical protein
VGGTRSASEKQGFGRCSQTTEREKSTNGRTKFLKLVGNRQKKLPGRLAKVLWTLGRDTGVFAFDELARRVVAVALGSAVEVDLFDQAIHQVVFEGSSATSSIGGRHFVPPTLRGLGQRCCLHDGENCHPPQITLVNNKSILLKNTTKSHLKLRKK